VTPGTHAISDNGSDGQEEEIINVGLGRVSDKFVWQIYSHFPHYKEYFVSSMVSSLTLLNWMPLSAYGHIFDIAPFVQFVVDGTR
jgi:hypothetical protein